MGNKFIILVIVKISIDVNYVLKNSILLLYIRYYIQLFNKSKIKIKNVLMLSILLEFFNLS